LLAGFRAVPGTTFGTGVPPLGRSAVGRSVRLELGGGYARGACMDEVVDYLIISDLHLRGGFQNPTAGLYHFDEEFADFLRHYRLHRGTDRPWRLIIDGALIGFLFLPH